MHITQRQMIVRQWGSQMTMLQDARPLLYFVIMAVTMNPYSEVMVTGQNSALLVDNRRFIML
jgi:hypothetical protein